MMISAFSSSLRKRAAHDAPPATPPMMTTFKIPVSLPISIICLLRDSDIQAKNLYRFTHLIL
jgi:hypothetical protein